MKSLKEHTKIKRFVDNTVVKRFSDVKKIGLIKKEKTPKKPTVCVVFSDNSVDFYFGEAETIKKYVLNDVKGKDFNENILLWYEKLPIEIFLRNSSSFIGNDEFLKCINALNSMKSVVNEGNDKFTSSENTLCTVFKKGNIASSLFIDYFYLWFRTEKHISVNGNIKPESSNKRNERFNELYKFFSKEFALLSRNLTSPKDIREAGLKPQKSQNTEKGRAYFCDSLSQLYADYIDFLRSEHIFFKKCAACGKIFLADNYRTKYDSDCAKKQIRQNHRKSDNQYKSDTTWLNCSKERNYYNNFKKRHWYLNSPIAYQKEYDKLFDEFKEELKKKKKIFKRIQNGEDIYFPIVEWLSDIKGRRENLEEEIKSLFKK